MIIFESIKSKAVAPIEPNIWADITIREMAEALHDMAANGEATTPESLMLRGYSSADITRYGLAAANLARPRTSKAVM